MRDRARCASQATEDREVRLQQRRYRLVAETADEREARLQYMRDRLAAETEEEREARLQYMRDRLTAETEEEREAGLQQIVICVGYHYYYSHVLFYCLLRLTPRCLASILVTCYVHNSNHWHCPGPSSTLVKFKPSDLTVLIMGNFHVAKLERINYFCIQ